MPPSVRDWVDADSLAAFMNEIDLAPFLAAHDERAGCRRTIRRSRSMPRESPRGPPIDTKLCVVLTADRRRNRLGPGGAIGAERDLIVRVGA